jgi:hypothetical protein
MKAKAMPVVSIHKMASVAAARLNERAAPMRSW